MKFTSFSRLFGKRRPAKGPKTRRPAVRQTRLQVEDLETRVLLAARPAILSVQPPSGSVNDNSHPALVITFNEPVLASDASNPANYLLFDAENHQITVDAANYSAANNTVVLSYNGGADLPADRYSLFVRGDRIHDASGALTISNPGQFIVSNAGNSTFSTINIPGDGSLEAISNYQANLNNFFGAANPVATTFADVNGDGIPDLIVADSGQTVTATATSTIGYVFFGLNQPGGGFANDPSVTLNVPASFFAQVGNPKAIVAADFNGDGKLDIAITDQTPFNGGFVTVFLNAGQGTFGPGVNYAAGQSPTGLVATDLNGDGKLDLAVVDTQLDQNLNFDVLVLTGNGSGSFNPATVINSGAFQTSGITSADFNGDNRPDLAISGSTGARVLFNNTAPGGVPTFTQGPLLAAGFENAIAAGHIDNSPLPGIVVTSNLNSNVTLFPNLGNGNFGTALTFPTGGAPTALAVANLNGDNYDDVLVTTSTGVGALATGTLNVLLNTTTPTTQARLAPPVPNAVNGAPVGIGVHAGANGVVDLAATANSTGGDVTLLRARGDGTFQHSTDQSLLPFNITPGPVAVGDLNGDGFPDLVMANGASLLTGNNTVAVFLANPGGGYRAPQQYPVGLNPVSITLADLTGTGKLDILVVNQGIGSGTDSTLTVLSNNGAGAFLPAGTIPVGALPTKVVAGDFNRDGHLDLAVSHLGNGGGGLSFPAGQPNLEGGVTLLIGNGDRTFRTPAEIPAAQETFGADLAVADFNNDGNLDLALLDGNPAGNVLLLTGDGQGNFQVQGKYNAGDNPTSLAVGDLDRDGFPDVVVTNHTVPIAGNPNNVSVAYISSLMNLGGIRLSSPIRTDIFTGANATLQSITITDVNQDLYPDVLATVGPPGAFSATGLTAINNVVSLLGVGDGSFRTPRLYATGAGGPTVPPSFGAVSSNPLVLATTFTTRGVTVAPNLILNGNFSKLDLAGERGNLNAWQTFNVQNSRGYFLAQAGVLSPLSGIPVSAPPSPFDAMLDEADLAPFTATQLLKPIDAYVFQPNPKTFHDYNGAHALYQDVTIPDTATSATLTFALYLNNTDPLNPVGYANNNPSNDLDYFENQQPQTQPPNQQVRVDIIDPNVAATPTFPGGPPDPNFVMNILPVAQGGALLQNLFTTTPATPRLLDYQTFTFDVSQYRGRKIRVRFAEANNQGKLIVGVTNVQLRASFQDTQPPTIDALRVRNPGFTDPATGLAHTTDTTVVGHVTSAGGPENIDSIVVDLNNDGDFNGPDDVRIHNIDPQGNFQITLPLTLPGPYTVGIQAISHSGNSTTTNFSFFLQGPSLNTWAAQGPGPTRWLSQGADYATVSGRVTATAIDPRDPSGNTLYIGSDNGGIWKTTDGGSNWTPLTAFVTSGGQGVPVPVGALAVDPNNPDNVYAGLGVSDTTPVAQPGTGLLKSVDAGKTWQLIAQSTFNGARISKLVVAKAFATPTNPNPAVKIYVAVAAGGQFGPGVYVSTDGGNSFTNILTPSVMFLDAGGTVASGTQLASVTDLVLDPFNEENLWVGMGNIGLLAPSVTGGVWRSTNGGNTWLQIVGGHDPRASVAHVLRTYLPPKLNSAGGEGPSGGGTPDGRIVGRVTLAMATGRAADETVVYALISNPRALGSNTDAGNAGDPVDVNTTNATNRFGLYKTSNSGLSWTHVMLRENVPIPNNPEHFVDLEFLGDEGGSVGALAVDPNDANVVYVGGSTRFIGRIGSISPTKGNQYPDSTGFDGIISPEKAFLRVDTSDMRDTNYASPYIASIAAITVPVTIPNDGDDIIKAALAAENVTPFAERGRYPAPIGVTYTGEGVFWYDLHTTDFGRLFVDPTFLERFKLPPVIYGLQFDQQGRLLVSTAGGIYRGVTQGWAYDVTSGGAGIAALEGFPTPNEPGTAFTELNGNLQIADQLSVASDAYNRHVIHTSQDSIGWTDSSGTLTWDSTNDPLLPEVLLQSTFIAFDIGLISKAIGPFADTDAFAFSAPLSTGAVRVGPRDPNAPAGTTSDVYRSYRLAVISSVQNPKVVGQIQRSVRGGQQGTFTVADQGLNVADIRNTSVLPLAVNPNFTTLNGQPDQSLLFFTNQVYESDSGTRPSGPVWDPVGGPTLANGEIATALASAPSLQDGFYVGTSLGHVFASLNDGIGGFTGPGTGLPAQKVNGISVSPTDPMIAYAMLGGFGIGAAHVFLTTNGGGSWSPLGGGAGGALPDVPAYTLAIDPRPTKAAPLGYLYVGTQVGVFVSTDLGGSWTPLGAGLPNVPVTDISLSTDFDQLTVATLGAGSYQISIDRTGPHALQLVPNAPTFPGISSVQVLFSEPIDPRTFTISQVRSFIGPNGPITPTSIVPLPNSDNSVFVINFLPQHSDGKYTLTIGPGITDFVGNQMDQNQNGIPGEDPGDRFSASFAINSSDNGLFVTGLYHDLLVRPADTDGFLTFLAPLDVARLQALAPVAQSRVASTEARTNLVAGFYSLSDPLGQHTPLPIGNFLGRSASPGELNIWVSALANGTSPEVVISSIVSSAEYFGKNGSTDQGFLTQLYVDLLARPADSQGLASWQSFLATSEETDRFGIAGAFTSSGEYQQNQVKLFFLHLLGRQPSPSELTLFAGELAAGLTQEQVQAQLIGSDEYFVNHGGNNTGWVNGAYLDILGRTPDPGGLSNALAALQAGASRESIALGLYQSVEYQTSLVRSYFSKYLGRDPGPAGVSNFVAAMQMGTRDETIIDQIVASNEYYQLKKSSATTLPAQDSNWVRALYNDILQRGPGPGEADIFLVPLANAESMSRFTVAQNFTTGGTEFHNRVIATVYGKYLGRPPSSGELNLWQGVLQQPSAAGQPSAIESFMTAVLSSSEYLQKNGNTNATWVESIYNNVLGRPSDPGGFKNALDAVLGGYAQQRLTTTTVMASSPENQMRFITDAYKTYLRRPALAAEIKTGLNQLQTGTTDEQFLAGIFASTEYFQNPTLGNSNNSTWLTQLYRDIFNRDRDAGSQVFLTGLNNGSLSRLQVATILLSSDEYRNNLITKFYNQFLGRTPGSSELAFYRGLMQNNGFTDEQVIAYITSSAEYFLRSHPYP
jgi:hypothetical protein